MTNCKSLADLTDTELDDEVLRRKRIDYEVEFHHALDLLIDAYNNCYGMLPSLEWAWDVQAYAKTYNRMLINES